MAGFDEETGSGLVGSLVGVTVFLVLLLFAVQLVLHLWATSTVTAAAFDAARIVAGAGGGRSSEAAAEGHARRLLDGHDEAGLRFEWRYPSTDGDAVADTVELRVVAENPADLLPGARFPFEQVDRTIAVRLERLR